MKNEHRISRVSPSEAMNIIYISTNAVDLSNHLPYKCYTMFNDSYNNIITAEAL